MTLILIVGAVIFLVVALLAVALIVTIVQQQCKLNDLLNEGIEVTAMIESVRLQKGFSLGFITVAYKQAQWRSEVTYRYADRAGQSHTGTYSDTTESEIAGMEAGGTFQIVYAAKNPRVSMPKYVVDRFGRTKK